MADDPQCPKDVLDAVMAGPTAQRLVHLMAMARDEDPVHCARWMRSDLSTVVVVALGAWVDVPSPRRTIDVTDDESVADRLRRDWAVPSSAARPAPGL